LGEKVIHTVSCRVGHPATETARAKSTSFARERYNSAVPTVFAPDAKKAVNWNATAKIGLELVKHEGWQFAASRFQIRQERRQVILYRSVEQRLFRPVASAGTGTRDRGRITNRWWQQGRPRQRLSDAQPTSCASPGRGRAMQQDYSWARAAQAYEQLYLEAYQRRRGHPFR
jgi:hypothetical protein